MISSLSLVQWQEAFWVETHSLSVAPKVLKLPRLETQEFQVHVCFGSRIVGWLIPIL